MVDTKKPKIKSGWSWYIIIYWLLFFFVAPNLGTYLSAFFIITGFPFAIIFYNKLKKENGKALWLSIIILILTALNLATFGLGLFYSLFNN